MGVTGPQRQLDALAVGGDLLLPSEDSLDEQCLPTGLADDVPEGDVPQFVTQDQCEAIGIPLDHLMKHARTDFHPGKNLAILVVGERMSVDLFSSSSTPKVGGQM